MVNHNLSILSYILFRLQLCLGYLAHSDKWYKCKTYTDNKKIIKNFVNNDNPILPNSIVVEIKSVIFSEANIFIKVSYYPLSWYLCIGAFF